MTKSERELVMALEQIKRLRERILPTSYEENRTWIIANNALNRQNYRKLRSYKNIQ